jgi:hypothetical protein
VDPSVLIAVLDDLERGLAERRRDPADRRRLIVEISARGTRLVAEVHRAIGAVEAELFADLDAGEIATLRGLLAASRPPSTMKPAPTSTDLPTHEPSAVYGVRAWTFQTQTPSTNCPGLRSN